MKNKKFTVLLFIGVALVWGFAIFQLVLNFSGNDPEYKTSSKITFSQSLLNKEESYELLLDYRDPFNVKKASYKRSSPVKPVNRLIKPKPVPEKVIDTPIDWSYIQFIGLISNRDKNKSIALVSLNGRDRMIAEGDTVDGVRFLKHYQDSIQVAQAANKTFIKRK